MSSKEFLGDAIKTLTRRVSSLSLASKKGRHDPHENNDAFQQPSTQAQDSGNPSVSRVSSATAVASDNGDPTALPRKPTSTSADWVDVVEIAPATSTTFPDPAEPVLPVTDTQILDAATACFPPVPENADLPPLPKPVLIPRLEPGSSVPFARAWPVRLADHAITQEDFVAFIDNFNIVIAPNVAIQVLGFTGAVVGLVPYDVAEGVGGALEAIAILSAIALNYKRIRDYLSRMNETYFHPRKLHVKVINTKRLKTILKLEKKDPLLAPLTEDTLELSSQERCLKYLSQHSCELSFDVPAPSPATTTLAKITAWQIRQKARKADKTAKAARKRTWKRHQKGKKLQGRWESYGEKSRVKSLDWLLVQNLEEWEARKAEKEAKKKERKKEEKGGVAEQSPAPAAI
ncbi:hypothetical protein F5B22DRAFT_544657 [Xylaria bambusicola]|uniref:uncharacterized protein n=1 Tax=Xylaria bambusicola TaxID=326684 RepID=UPI002007E877|nr:uncharacterized protein F5B22DRAFT_544657 [Xylaria bambusicola]KAI0521602.1 hypothetical protein F5B22DRAFT_544657 [Xylaria bambusicola]